jgi:hypothetical protein
MPVLDRVFYSLNSYFSPNPRSDDVLNKADAELGAELRFTLLFLGYFEANLATEGPADSTCERIAEAGGCGASQAGIAREIAGMSFRPNAGFRKGTTPAYFELLGSTREYETLASANWLSDDRNRSLVRALTRSFWKVAGQA